MENGSATVARILHGDDSNTEGSLPWKILGMLAKIYKDLNKMVADFWKTILLLLEMYFASEKNIHLKLINEGAVMWI